MSVTIKKYKQRHTILMLISSDNKHNLKIQTLVD